MERAASPIFCAIDTPDPARAQELANAVRGVVNIKLGLEFFVANGPGAVRRVASGAPLFLDLKLHDIPNTVAGAVRAAASLKPMLLTIHCGGGPAMMRAAVEAAQQAAAGGRRMQLLGVTVLTSLDNADLDAVGQRGPTTEHAVRLARLARDCGLDGVVCSPHEIAALREACGKEFLLVVPGIRPSGIAAGDQKRVLNPRAALDAGADYLVIGRPITGAPDPRAVARAMRAALQ
ncbi:MAG TPA: orotidine-5'-phosphate decarboxylase [Stellaceae bacterium]|nr:orotidine-5'-phosphate decarboxylase [Stellaceae bacterium]